jgi:hypothetical protein
MRTLHTTLRALLPSMLLAGALLAGCRTPRPDPAPQAFTWPVPPGWRPETIPFPLGFARDLPYRGVEELRFAPGVFDPASPSYWSYAFVWWLEGQPALEPATLERDLVRYFRGLSLAVGGKKFRLDPGRFRATLTEEASSQQEQRPVRRLRGQVDSYDAFTTGKELTLNVEVLIWDCPAARRRVLLCAASPQPSTAEVWVRLRQAQASFVCR